MELIRVFGREQAYQLAVHVIQEARGLVSCGTVIPPKDAGLLSAQPHCGAHEAISQPEAKLGKEKADTVINAGKS